VEPESRVFTVGVTVTVGASGTAVTVTDDVPVADE
jgi:hypothetical protein